MKKIVFLLFLSIVGYFNADGQIAFQTEYFGKSSYRMSEGDKSEKVGDSEGSAIVYRGGINIPLSVKLNDDNRPTAWSVSAGGAYAKLDNKNFTEPLVIDEILNLGININHLRPISQRWSMMLSVGGGAYMPTTRLSQVRFKNILGNVGAIFIYHLKPNLELGGGIALNNSFGYPMAFPALYLNWTTTGRYDVKISMFDGIELSAGCNLKPNFSLRLIAEMNGQMAIIEQEGKDKIFTHQYMVVGLRPEIKIGKKLSIPITVGINAMRPAEIKDRSLKAMFRDDDYYFQVSPYLSGGLKMNF